MTGLTICMPAHNEAENIQRTVLEALGVLEKLSSRKAIDRYEVIVVDDGSRDATAGVVQSLTHQHPQVRLIRHDTNRGYGAAVFSGLTGASLDLVFFTDGDGQFDLEELTDLLEALGGGDMVIGHRSPRRDPLIRKLNGWGWSWLVNVLFGYTARDVDCAFKIMRREVIQFLQDRVKSRGATFSAEFLVRARLAGYRIREIPIRGHRPRRSGQQSGARPGVILRAFRELLLFRVALWQETHHKVLAQNPEG
jgi:glycosyltransferase involved in cell wall biosynthesis